MYEAIVRKASRVVETIKVLTRCFLGRLIDILPEIELFSWVNFTSCRYLKVCIRYFTVSITVKAVEHLFELLICQK